jgi:outer membrane protein assembly factor BamB
MRNDLAALLSAIGVVAAAFIAQAQGADGDWPMFGRDALNQRFAPFAAIDRNNVSQLAPSWIYPLGTVGSAQTHPIVIDGVMYVGMAGNDVAALDATTGREIWRYRHVTRRALPQIPSNRGVAIADGRVFEATDDARVIALDQATGKLIWDKAVLPYDASALAPKGTKLPDVEFQFRAAPFIHEGKVIVGATGFEANRFDDDLVKASLAAGTDVGKAWIDANLGRRAFLAALDTLSGAEVWRWYTTKEDGWEGDYAPTAPDGTPLNRDIGTEKAAAPLYKNAWAAGSNSTWMTPAYDAASGLIFVGTGNPAPGDVDLVRPGDNLYANGVAAVDARTGSLRWFFQESPHGQYDATGQAVLFDARVDGRAVSAVLECGKSGWCFAIDRASGKLLFRSEEVVPHINTYAVPSAEGIRVSPAGGGAVSVSPVSYDPVSGVVYVAARHAPVIQTQVSVPNIPGGSALFKTTNRQVSTDETWGTLTALDIDKGGRVLWQVKTPQPLVGGTLATAGGLVFTGEPNGRFNAYDAATGAALWSADTGASVGAPPMSYVVNGRQFVAVATGRPAGVPQPAQAGRSARSRYRRLDGLERGCRRQVARRFPRHRVEAAERPFGRAAPRYREPQSRAGASVPRVHLLTGVPARHDATARRWVIVLWGCEPGLTRSAWQHNLARSVGGLTNCAFYCCGRRFSMVGALGLRANTHQRIFNFGHVASRMAASHAHRSPPGSNGAPHNSLICGKADVPAAIGGYRAQLFLIC